MLDAVLVATLQIYQDLGPAHSMLDCIVWGLLSVNRSELENEMDSQMEITLQCK